MPSTDEFGYGADKDNGPYSCGPAIVGFDSLSAAVKYAKGWLKKGQKWDSKTRRYVEREDGIEVIRLWKGERISSNHVRWEKSGILVSHKIGKLISVTYYRETGSGNAA